MAPPDLTDEKLKPGDPMAINLPGGRMAEGSILIRAVNCGKARCRKCARGELHKWYGYIQWRDGKKVHQRYLGVASGPTTISYQTIMDTEKRRLQRGN
jgi:hypothetical protein